MEIKNFFSSISNKDICLFYPYYEEYFEYRAYYRYFIKYLKIVSKLLLFISIIVFLSSLFLIGIFLFIIGICSYIIGEILFKKIRNEMAILFRTKIESIPPEELYLEEFNILELNRDTKRRVYLFHLLEKYHTPAVINHIERTLRHEFVHWEINGMFNFDSLIFMNILFSNTEIIAFRFYCEMNEFLYLENFFVNILTVISHCILDCISLIFVFREIINTLYFIILQIIETILHIIYPSYSKNKILKIFHRYGTKIFAENSETALELNKGCKKNNKYE